MNISHMALWHAGVLMVSHQEANRLAVALNRKQNRHGDDRWNARAVWLEGSKQYMVARDLGYNSAVYLLRSNDFLEMKIEGEL